MMKCEIQDVLVVPQWCHIAYQSGHSVLPYMITQIKEFCTGEVVGAELLVLKCCKWYEGIGTGGPQSHAHQQHP